jgi:hypothetical protein
MILRKFVNYLPVDKLFILEELIIRIQLCLALFECDTYFKQNLSPLIKSHS